MQGSRWPFGYEQRCGDQVPHPFQQAWAIGSKTSHEELSSTAVKQGTRSTRTKTTFNRLMEDAVERRAARAYLEGRSAAVKDFLSR